MQSCPTQAVLPLVGLAAEKVIRDRYISAPKVSAGLRLPVSPSVRHLRSAASGCRAS
ncbi:MAG: hypothetical protein R6U98_03155 [Pirellulaceae bacterium]